MALGFSTVPIDQVSVAAYTIPTDSPEADGTIEWERTTIVIVIISAGAQQGLGYTYASEEVATVVRGVLEKTVLGADALSPPAVYEAMWRRVRNLGRAGLCSTAISAVDCAMWDLKARILGVPLVALLGQVRNSVPVYGSGGFTSYSDEQLAKQFVGWAEQGIPAVKMKIGRDAKRDLERVGVARTAIGKVPELYVDANGAYTRKQALVQAERFFPMGVTWFEEPVSSDDLAGLRLLRDRAPAGIDIAAGEYGYEIFYFERMLSTGAVDVLQADITRCGGVTSFLQVAALCQAHNVQLSAHTAPTLHAQVACSVPLFKNIEYFYDHVRIERMLFDGIPLLKNGELRPDASRPGNGLILKRVDVEKFAA